MHAGTTFSVQSRRRQNMLSITVILLLILGWYFLIRQTHLLTQTTITAYQQTQLETVRAMARSVESYVAEQLEGPTQANIAEHEQEIFKRFVEPVHLLENGDAWIYAPDHVVFDRSSDFPDEYRDKSMAQIFELQSEQGARHYEEMTEAVMNAREGVGWYIWLPDKGREIAAWTPVFVGEYTWVIGLSTPLPEILASTGATTQTRTSIILMALSTIVAFGLLIAWRGNANHRAEVVEALRESETKFRTLTETTAAAIFIFQGTQNRYVNPAAEAVTGYSQTELVHMNFWDVIHPDFREEIKEQGEVRQRGEPVPRRHEIKLLTKNGQERWVDVTLALTDFEGRPAVLGTAFDVTARKQAEAERERLLTSEREQRELAETLSEVILALTAHTSREAVLDEILHQVSRVVSHSAANVMLLKGNSLYIGRWKGYETHGSEIFLTSLNQSLADLPLDARVVYARQPLIVTDTQQESDWTAFEETAWIRSFVAVPICQQDRVLGLLRLDSDTPHKFCHDDIDRLRPLANAAAIALENAHLYEQIRQELAERRQAEKEILRLNRKLMALQYAGATIASSLDLSYILNTVTREMINLLEVDGCAISDWDEVDNVVTTISEQGLADWWDQHESSDQVYDLDNYPLTEHVLRKRQAEQMTISDPDLEPNELAYMQSAQLKTLLMLPMEFKDHVLGLVEVTDSRIERTFAVDEIALAQFLANQAAAAIENARLYEQVRQELEERVQAQQALQRVMAQNEAILNAIPDSMFYFNRAEKLLDFRLIQDDLLADLCSDMKIGDDLRKFQAPNLVKEPQEHIAQIFITGEIQLFEFQLPAPVGQQYYEARLVASGSDEALAIVRNITERKQAERNIIRAERLAALGQLAAALAHEINNPLQAMQSNIDLIVDFPLEPGESERYLQIIRYEIERLRDIAQRVLSFAHPKSAPRQQLHVTDLMEQVLSLTKKRLEQKGVQLTTNFQEVPPVVAAPNHLNQVFLNLVNNAVEALTEDGQLDIAIYPEENDVAVSFTNNGPVIPDEILSHIFEPFFTTKSDGSGLGLWISHSLVEQHAGSMTVENLGDQRGVIFTVKLPVVPASDE